MSRVYGVAQVILALFVTGLLVGGLVDFAYSRAVVRIPILGWQVPLFIAYVLVATAIRALAEALGMDFGESDESISADDWDDWDD